MFLIRLTLSLGYTSAVSDSYDLSMVFYMAESRRLRRELPDFKVTRHVMCKLTI